MRDANENSLKSLMKMVNNYYLESKKENKDNNSDDEKADKAL
jgi:hypothetical protein